MYLRKMDILLKLETVILLTTIISTNLVTSSTNYTCSLDSMKLFAVEACENIFKSFEFTQDDDNRDKREIWKTDYNQNGIGEHKNHHSKVTGNEMVKVRRKDYPEGGFIRINRNHATILTKTNNDYKIVNRKFHNKFAFPDEKEYRHKRNAAVHVPYCCVRNCRVDFFCKR